MVKGAGKFLWLFFVLALIIGGVILNGMLPIATGFAAKNMCSCVFVAKRPPADIQATDLNFSLVQFTTSNVDTLSEMVTSRLLGLYERKAVYRPGLGCSLVFDEPVSQKIQNPELDCISATDGAIRETREGVKARTEYTYDREWATDTTMLRHILDSTLSSSLEDGVYETRTLLVLHQGHLIAESYAPGFDPATLQLGWSMSKSVTNAIAGLLVKQGMLSIDMPAPIPEWQQDDRKQITVRHLLQHTAGLEWEELYGTATDVTKMLYKQPSKSAYAISKPLATRPGEEWVYSSGASNILTHILMQPFTDPDAFICYVAQNLFQAVGLTSMIMEADASDELVGSSYTYANARDWARFGQLYLQRGIWRGQRILPEGWIQFTTTEARGSEGGYGAQFWLNKSGKLPDVPKDMYYADGFQGQRVFILPSHDLVVVRLAVSSEFDYNGFLQSVMRCFKEEIR